MKIRQILLVCLFIIPLFSRVSAQYAICPKPFLSILQEGNFVFSGNYQAESYSRDSLFNQEFQTWVKKDALPKIAPNKTVQTKISLQIVGVKRWTKYLRKLQLNFDFNPEKEGYVIKIEKNNILLLAQTETGLFYGFQTIRQLFKLPEMPCGEIYDKPSFPVRAWQDDISRGPIPTMDQLKKEILTLSQYKLNFFTLYTEHVFKYKMHPDIAPEEGISAEEIKQLTQFAAQYHVELIANQQSFGHMEKVLSKAPYAYLGEKQHILSPAQPGTYRLLEDFYKEQTENYKGSFFHINADETFGLGTEQSKSMLDSMGIENLYAFHINKVYDLLKPSGKTLVMWSDIIASYPDIRNKIPKDIVLVPWAYDASENFKPMLEPIVKSGFHFWVAPGISNWLNLYPNIHVARTNIYNLIRDGKKLGANGVLNTSWDDDGFVLFGNNWQGLAWGADLSWNAPESDANKEAEERWNGFFKSFDLQFWGIPLSKIQGEFAAFHQKKARKILSNAVFFEPIFPIYPEHLGADLETSQKELLATAKHVYKMADSLGNDVKQEILSITQLKFAIREAQFSIEKNIFRIHYSDFLLEKYSKEKILLELGQLITQLKNLRNDFSFLYLSENRPWWLDKNLEKFDRLLYHLQELPFHCLIIPDEALSKKGWKFTLKAPLTDEPIYYTLDSSKGNQTSIRYEKPFFMKQDAQISCGVLANQTLHQTTNDSFVYHLGIGKIKKINLAYSKYHSSYSGGGPMALVDGKTGALNYLSSGRWQGYSGNDLIIEMQFEKPVTMKEFQMAFYQNTPSWVILPKELQLLVSDDGIQYQSITTLKHQVPVNSNEKIRYVFQQFFSKQKINYLKIICKYSGPLPAGHPSAGSDSMLFSDEIIIK